jgi:poly-beta-hydroxyalkanoate depolymerase
MNRAQPSAGSLHRRTHLSQGASHQAGVGHYGVFSGRRWNNEIYPLLRDFVHVNS